ncbi:hypothetical protein ACW73L_20950 [Methylolobus aquaticus]|uniref:hypothetical protein n=1 Tax=Methylotetracoccus oryzae TaxID=1919059 RepID=UPI00101F47BC|nr:hypothetical protein [Methylotetracoccus oryzae]RYU62068.1 hypothetical protein EWI61_04630 [Methylolobus aquaticus]
MTATETVSKETTTVECVVHVRFNNDGTVMEIGECPEALTPNAWFKLLSRKTLNCYQALAGGRGLFRLPRTEVDTLKAAAIAEQAS